MGKRGGWENKAGRARLRRPRGWVKEVVIIPWLQGY
jgi:hypothetical protein